MKLFFSTELAPCPYLPGRLERRLVTLLEGPDPDRLHDRLMQAGFRRSQGLAYRPACPGCTACVPVPHPGRAVSSDPGLAPDLAQNADLVAAERRPVATREQFALFQRYLASRHGESGMAAMAWADFCAMIDDSPVDSRLVEWRRPDGSLIAASLTDRSPSGLSGRLQVLRSRREPALARQPDHPLAREPRAELGLPYAYLGYWIAHSPKMAYKARFQPLEQLTRAAAGSRCRPPA